MTGNSFFSSAFIFLFLFAYKTQDFRHAGSMTEREKSKKNGVWGCTCTDSYEVGFVSAVTSVLLRLVMGDMYSFLFHVYNGSRDEMSSMNDRDERLLGSASTVNQASLPHSFRVSRFVKDL